MRVVVAGFGVQGRKRRMVAGDDFVAAVDPANQEASYRSLVDVPLDRYDAVLACVPDAAKVDLLSYCLEHGKHVVFYRQERGGVLVSRILHQRMLPDRHAIDDEDHEP